MLNPPNKDSDFLNDSLNRTQWEVINSSISPAQDISDSWLDLSASQNLYDSLTNSFVKVENDSLVEDLTVSLFEKDTIKIQEDNLTESVFEKSAINIEEDLLSARRFEEEAVKVEASAPEDDFTEIEGWNNTQKAINFISKYQSLYVPTIMKSITSVMTIYATATTILSAPILAGVTGVVIAIGAIYDYKRNNNFDNTIKAIGAVAFINGLGVAVLLPQVLAAGISGIAVGFGSTALLNPANSAGLVFSTLINVIKNPYTYIVCGLVSSIFQSNIKDFIKGNLNEENTQFHLKFEEVWQNKVGSLNAAIRMPLNYLAHERLHGLIDTALDKIASVLSFNDLSSFKNMGETFISNITFPVNLVQDTIARINKANSHERDVNKMVDSFIEV